MSYISETVIQDFYEKDHFIVKQSALVTIDSLVQQIDGIIKSYTGIATPLTPATASPLLQNIACRLFVWFAAGKEGVTKESVEHRRRETLYNSAIEDLEKIKAGTMKVYNIQGNEITVSNSKTAMFESTKRITGIL